MAEPRLGGDSFNQRLSIVSGGILGVSFERQVVQLCLERVALQNSIQYV